MKKNCQSRITRRGFIGSAGAATAFTIVPRHALTASGKTAPSDKLNIACVGVGSRRNRRSSAKRAMALSIGSFEAMASPFRIWTRPPSTINRWRSGSFSPKSCLTVALADLQLYGKSPSAPFKARIREVKQGPLTYEFIQPVEGNGIFKESLDRRGEGAIDMTFTVADLKAETAKLVGKGVKVAMSGTTKSGAFAYFDTRKKGGDVFIKLIEEK